MKPEKIETAIFRAMSRDHRLISPGALYVPTKHHRQTSRAGQTNFSGVPA